MRSARFTEWLLLACRLCAAAIIAIGIFGIAFLSPNYTPGELMRRLLQLLVLCAFAFLPRRLYAKAGARALVIGAAIVGLVACVPDIRVAVQMDQVLGTNETMTQVWLPAAYAVMLLEGAFGGPRAKAA